MHVDQQFDKWLEDAVIEVKGKKYDVYSATDVASDLYFALLLAAFQAGWDANNRQPYELG